MPWHCCPYRMVKRVFAVDNSVEHLDSPFDGRNKPKDTVHVLRMKRFYSRVEETAAQAASSFSSQLANSTAPPTGELCYDDNCNADACEAHPVTSAAQGATQSYRANCVQIKSKFSKLAAALCRIPSSSSTCHFNIENLPAISTYAGHQL